ncbi:MAG: prepilin-type N-terminal cleavage/methylation domain-containing protein [Nitrospirae bacterium]|nr:prepilin-type N-terminal cleavage/methylation domain-containing protein [Nitrospirota bacterium]
MGNNLKQDREPRMGFTLLELLVVMAITGIIAAASMAMFAAFNRTYRMQANIRRAQQTMAIVGNQVIETIAKASGGFQGSMTVVNTSNCGGNPCRRMGFEYSVSKTAGEMGVANTTAHVVQAKGTVNFGALTTGTGYWCLARTATGNWAGNCNMDGNGSCQTSDPAADYFCRGNGRVGGAPLPSGTLQFRNIQFNCYTNDNLPVACNAGTPKRIELVVQARVCVETGCASAFVALPTPSPAGSGWLDQTWASSQVILNDFQTPGGGNRRPF